MYEINASLTKENLLSKIDSYSIFKYYCNNFKKIGKPFRSPFHEDAHPSAFIIYYNGDFMFKDFGGETLRAVDFVMKMYNLSFRDALEKINYDFGLNLDGKKGETIEFPEIEDEIIYEAFTSIIKVKKRDWNERDISYWGEFGIGYSTLKKFNVVPISFFSINDWMYKAAELAYSYEYYWEEGIFRRKIYQPLSKNKWYSNGGFVVQGEGMLPKYGDLLIITSSLKDVMALYELGYIAIAPTSETSFVPEIYFKKQNSRFKRIILFMDSDTTGIKRSLELNKKWQLDYILIPPVYNKKDISDFNKTYGKELSKILIKDLLK